MPHTNTGTRVKGGVRPWRGAEQNRSAQSYVYPGPPDGLIAGRNRDTCESRKNGAPKVSLNPRRKQLS
jgi:hypothetical protein